MDASEALYEAKKSGDPAKVIAAQRAYDAVMAETAAHRPS